jgi:hypothetical protein
LDFVHHINYKIRKLQHFGSWMLLPSSGSGLRLAQPGGPTDRVSVLFSFYLNTEAEFSFQNAIVL